MEKGGLFSRILRGRKEAKKPELEQGQEPQSPISQPVEKILNVPLSRRRVLGGAATTASMAAMPHAPVVIQQGVKEAAALLAPRLGGLGFVDQVLRLNKSFEYTEDGEPSGKFSPTIEDTFVREAPLASTGEWAHQQFFEMSWLSNLHLPKSLKLSDLKDPNLIAEAYRLAGEKSLPDDTFIQNLKDAVTVLQRVTGVGDDKTVGDLEKGYAGKIVSIARKVLDDPNTFPPSITDNMDLREKSKRGTTLKYLRDTLRYARAESADPELTRRIEIETQRDKDYWDERKRARLEAEARRELPQQEAEERARVLREERQRIQEKKEREEFNDKLKERKGIECTVQNATREPRDDSTARVFLVKPENYPGVGEFNGLTRMHIQHLRQLLVAGAKGKGLKKPTLDTFDPASTKVEEVGDMLRVSTTDKKFQNYLASFATSSRRLLIPNRLQIVVPTERKE